MAEKIKVIRGLLDEASLSHIKLSVAEVGGVFYSDELIKSVDVIMPNLYPFWQGNSLSEAVTIQENLSTDMNARAVDKPVILGEIGWPTAGNQVGQAMPTIENLQKFIRGAKILLC